MNAERLAEIKSAYIRALLSSKQEERAVTEMYFRELLDHIAQLEAQVARGGAVVLHRDCGTCASYQDSGVQPNCHKGCDTAEQWTPSRAFASLRTVDASQVLQPGMVGVLARDLEYLLDEANEKWGPWGPIQLNEVSGRVKVALDALRAQAGGEG